jgi:mannose-6-phosphate isomerase-like protein (cupin superfamily)
MRAAILITTVLFSTAALAQAPARPKTPTDADTLIPASQFATILANGPSKDGKPGSLSAQLFNGGVASTSFIRITEPDTPHAHGTTSEIYVIQDGEGSIETGGEMVGPFNGNSAVHTAFFVSPDGKSTPVSGGQAAAPAAAPAAGDAAPAGARAGGGGGGGGRNANPGGPHDGAGTAVAGGRTQKVKAGDVILIPAGVPHHWVGVDKPLVYLDIKFPKGNGGNGGGGGNANQP